MSSGSEILKLQPDWLLRGQTEGRQVLSWVCLPVLQALEEMNGKDLEGENIEIVFAKPPDQRRKERKAQRQAAKTQM